jgi:heme A synthase
LIAILVGFYLVFISVLIAMFRSDRWIRRLAIGLVGLFVLQLTAGLVNLVLLAPIWMQLTHLLLADVVWVTLVLLSAASLAAREASSPVVEPTQPAGYAKPQQVN